MEKYGRIKDDRLELSSKQREGFKPVVYEQIPEDFNQTTHYVVQSKPVEEPERIYVGIEIQGLPEDLEGDNFDGEIVL